MSVSPCPDVAAALAAGDVDAATELAVGLIAAGRGDDPAVAEVALVWASRAASRLGRASSGSWEDSLSECCVEVLSLMHDYRPGPAGSSAAAYLATWVPRVASAAQGRRRWHDDQKMRRASALLAAAREDLQGIDPWVSEDDIYQEAVARMHGQYIEDARPRHRQWSEVELFEHAKARARKDGMDRAFADLRRGVDQFADPVSLDVPNDDGSARFDVAERLPADNGSEDGFESLVRMLLGDEQWARPALGALFGTDVDGQSESESLSGMARLLKVSPARLKDVRKAAALRARSPHAHWAHLSPVLQAAQSCATFLDQ